MLQSYNTCDKSVSVTTFVTSGFWMCYARDKCDKCYSVTTFLTGALQSYNILNNRASEVLCACYEEGCRYMCHSCALFVKSGTGVCHVTSRPCVPSLPLVPSTSPGYL